MKNTTMTVRDVVGWPLGFLTGSDVPLIRDIDLAERLGYARPRKIRDLIRKMFPKDGDGKILDVEQRPATGRYEIRPGVTAPEQGVEFWLTEAQALKVSARSETEPADALLDEMIHVFMLARRGQLAGPQLSEEVLAMVVSLVSTVQTLEHRVAILAVEAGTISGVQADWITGEIDVLADCRMRLGYHGSMRAAKAWIQARIGAAAQWSGTGTKRREMPAASYPRVKVCLAQLRADLEAEARRRNPRKRAAAVKTAPQAQLFTGKPN